MKPLITIWMIMLTGGYFNDPIIPVDKESKVTFTIKNFGFNTDGSFQGLQGKIHFDPQQLTSSYFDVSIDATTIDTDITSRDNHLKKEEYLHVQKYPRIHFKSFKINQQENRYMVHGNITIKGVTRQVSFPFTVQKTGAGYWFRGEFKINRREFGVGKASAVLGDMVTVQLKVLAK